MLKKREQQKKKLKESKQKPKQKLKDLLKSNVPRKLLFSRLPPKRLSSQVRRALPNKSMRQPPYTCKCRFVVLQTPNLLINKVSSIS
jgi:hypothetical protein